MIDLKPCQFCGEAPFWATDGDGIFEPYHETISCLCRHATTPEEWAKAEPDYFWQVIHAEHASLRNLGKALWMVGLVKNLLEELYHEAFGDGFCSDNVNEVYTPDKTVREVVRRVYEELQNQ